MSAELVPTSPHGIIPVVAPRPPAARCPCILRSPEGCSLSSLDHLGREIAMSQIPADEKKRLPDEFAEIRKRVEGYPRTTT